MSSANLSAQLKDKLQMTFSDYLTSLRIQNAKQLLKNPNVSVQTVAEESATRIISISQRYLRK